MEIKTSLVDVGEACEHKKPQSPWSSECQFYQLPCYSQHTGTLQPSVLLTTLSFLKIFSFLASMTQLLRLFLDFLCWLFFLLPSFQCKSSPKFVSDLHFLLLCTEGSSYPHSWSANTLFMAVIPKSGCLVQTILHLWTGRIDLEINKLQV